ncbi:membrane protein [Capsulimonas corticalis]|uniref:Membrane protein n=2 Tax=Capsulimonas corticalis TaxID=2219043 RepID=A0A9N7QF33_9BACT|nr:membrane protein [Capsulimonas corticalis]
MQTLLHPYLDGELDLMTSLQVEEHLRTCASCELAYQNFQVLREGLRDSALYFQPPANLEARVLSPMRRAEAPRRPSFRLGSWRRWSTAAVLLVAVGLSWRLAHAPAPLPDDRALEQEIVSSHVRSLMGSHLADIASSSHHTVKPWFSGKLDYSPPVDDLGAQGFPLIGGRLDYLNGRPVAALIYRRQKHLINLFVWPAKAGDSNGAGETKAMESQGYHLIHWNAAGMTYWSISDLNPSELSSFVQLYQAQDQPPARPASK